MEVSHKWNLTDCIATNSFKPFYLNQRLGLSFSFSFLTVLQGQSKVKDDETCSAADKQESEKLIIGNELYDEEP